MLPPVHVVSDKLQHIAVESKPRSYGAGKTLAVWLKVTRGDYSQPWSERQERGRRPQGR